MDLLLKLISSPGDAGPRFCCWPRGLAGLHPVGARVAAVLPVKGKGGPRLAKDLPVELGHQIALLLRPQGDLMVGVLDPRRDQGRCPKSLPP